MKFRAKFPSFFKNTKTFNRFNSRLINPIGNIIYMQNIMFMSSLKVMLKMSNASKVIGDINSYSSSNCSSSGQSGEVAISLKELIMTLITSGVSTRGLTSFGIMNLGIQWKGISRQHLLGELTTSTTKPRCD